MLRIRPMLQSDIPFAVNITNAEGWGIPARDFRRVLQLDPHGSFIALDGRRRVGLTTTTRYSRQIAWIGNVVVQKNDRGKHIGQDLVEHAVAYLTRKRVRRIALYCFNENVEFYRRLGFIPREHFLRLRREPTTPRREYATSRDYESYPFSRVLAMDRRAFGADRSRLIKLLLDSGRSWYLTSLSSDAAAYALVKEYDDMNEIGPWVSLRTASVELDSMLHRIIGRSQRKPVEVACPLSKGVALKVLRRRGFRTINYGRLMYYERIGKIGQPKAIVAYGFLDKG